MVMPMCRLVWVDFTESLLAIKSKPAVSWSNSQISDVPSIWQAVAVRRRFLHPAPPSQALPLSEAPAVPGMMAQAHATVAGRSGEAPLTSKKWCGADLDGQTSGVCHAR